MKTIPTTLYAIILGIFLVIASPGLLTEGMFMDGVIYATVARNMAFGLGSFWIPQHTLTMLPEFFEHPPLALGRESILFRWLGDHLYVERLYSLLTILISSIVVVFIWRSIVSPPLRSLAWLPLLMLLPLPIVAWAAGNNMLENTMMIFTSLSILFLIKSVGANRYGYHFMASVWLVAAFFTKGPVALFPLSFFFWVLLFSKSYSWPQFVLDTSLYLTFTLVLTATLFLFIPQSLENLQQYYQNQILDSFENAVTVSTRLHILERLFMEFLPSILMVVLVILFVRGPYQDEHSRRWTYIFIGLGLSAVIPIMVSLKQRGFYILPALPILAIAAALFVAPQVRVLQSKLQERKLIGKLFGMSGAAILILGIVMNLINLGEPGRDSERLRDVYKLVEIIPPGTIITTSADLGGDYSLQSYLYRYGYLSLDHRSAEARAYLLLPAGDNPEKYGDYVLSDDSLELYRLYHHRPSQ